MERTVRPFSKRSNDFWIASSVSVSTAEVASSKIKIFGSAKRALAIEILCFSPPERERLEEPKSVLYPCS